MPHLQDTDDPITEINVVPLVDIMLVLLIIFMMTASFFSSPSIPVNVPKSYTANPAVPESQSVVLNAKGELFFQGNSVDAENLKKDLRQVVALNPDIRIILSADASVMNAKVVELLDLIRQQGATKIALGVANP